MPEHDVQAELRDQTERDALASEIAAACVFDAAWYVWRNEDVAAAGLDPFAHYIDYGRREDRWPNRYFDPARYRQENPDVADAGADPLLHYIRHGEHEGRQPHPRFDPGWYRMAYGLTEQALALTHFLAHRAQGALPSPALYVVPRIPPYRDVASDPVAAYLDAFEAGGLDPLPDIPVVRASGLVEDNYYLINAADVHAASVDPAMHYCLYGWREHRKPNIYFDAEWYLQTNPEVARLQINPLAHYILEGEAANRRPVPFFDPGWYREEYRIPAGQTALGHYLVNRRKQLFSPTPLFDVAWYIARFGADLGPNRDPFAHYLQIGMTQDIDPSREFNAGRYRRTRLGRPSRGFLRVMRPDQHNPLVHYLRAEYAVAKLPK